MGEEIDNEKDDLASTTITFRIRAKEKEDWQFAADTFAQGNISKFIKRSVSRYMHERIGPVTLLRKGGGNVDKYFRELFQKVTGSTDPAILQAKWDEERPKMVMSCVQQLEEQLQRAQEQFKTDLGYILSYHLQLD